MRVMKKLLALLFPWIGVEERAISLLQTQVIALRKDALAARKQARAADVDQAHQQKAIAELLGERQRIARITTILTEQFHHMEARMDEVYGNQCPYCGLVNGMKISHECEAFLKQFPGRRVSLPSD